MPKTGVARVGFIRFSSGGKSTLMSKLTGTFSAVAAYEFTTLTTVPSVLAYNGAKIQILDLPESFREQKTGRTGENKCWLLPGHVLSS